MANPDPKLPRRAKWSRLWQWLLLAVAVFTPVAGFASLSGVLATVFTRQHSYPLPPTSVPDALPGTPSAQYVPLDPAVVAALAYQPVAYDVIPLVVLRDVVPIGAYMPRTGNTLFELATGTPNALVGPLPTSPPALEQSSDAGILSTSTPHISPLGGPGALPYAGDGCAPRGLPTSGLFTQRFHCAHSGVDTGVPIGTPVHATHSGLVIFAGWSVIGYGNLVIIQNGAFITYYAHLNGFNVVEGQRVGVDSVIGWSGNTGNSSGPHIHYEVRINDVPVDPLTFDSRGYPWC